MICFSIIVLITSFSGILGAIFLYITNERYTITLKQSTVYIEEVNSIALDLALTRVYLRDVMLHKDPEVCQSSLKRINEYNSSISEHVSRLKTRLISQEATLIFLELEQQIKKYNTARDNAIALALEGDNEQADIYMRDNGLLVALKCEDLIKKLNILGVNNADYISTQLDAQSYQTLSFMFIVILLSFIAGLLISGAATRSINRPLKMVENAAIRIANFDTNFDLDVQTNDEIRTVANVLNNSVKKAFAELNDKNKMIMDSLAYARKIQKNILPDKTCFDTAFSDYEIIWKPKEYVGGDFYWIANFSVGTLLFIGDCTGHGTPGAMLTMLCVSILNSVVNEYNVADLQRIIWDCDRKFTDIMSSDNITEDNSLIHDTLDFGMIFINKTGQIKFATKNMRLHICDGKNVTTIKGIRTKSKNSNFTEINEIKVYEIEYNPSNKFYIASDGLFDQIGIDRRLPFGYSIFSEIILTYHNQPIKKIVASVWDTFNKHMGDECRRDDVTLIGFKF